MGVGSSQYERETEAALWLKGKEAGAPKPVVDEQGPALCIVKKGHPNQCVFKESFALQDDPNSGTQIKLSLLSHPGCGVVVRHPRPKVNIDDSRGSEADNGTSDSVANAKDDVRYYEVGVGVGDGISVRRNGSFIVLDYDSMVLDVVWGMASVEYMPMVLVRRSTLNATFCGGAHCARKFVFNKDGTVSPKKDLSMVIGVSPPRLVLVRAGSPTAIRLAAPSDIRKRKKRPFVTASGWCIQPAAAKGTETQGHSWMAAVLSKNFSNKLNYNNGYFRYRDEDKRAYVMDILMWKFEEGSSVNFISGKTDKETYVPGGGRTFTISEEGFIQPVNHPNLALGTDCCVPLAEAIISHTSTVPFAAVVGHDTGASAAATVRFVGGANKPQGTTESTKSTEARKVRTNTTHLPWQTVATGPFVPGVGSAHARRVSFDDETTAAQACTVKTKNTRQEPQQEPPAASVNASLHAPDTESTATSAPSLSSSEATSSAASSATSSPRGSARLTPAARDNALKLQR